MTMGGPWNTGLMIGVRGHYRGYEPKHSSDDLGTNRPDQSDNWRSSITSASGSDFRRACAALGFLSRDCGVGSTPTAVENARGSYNKG
jgi:hypothetical protein